MDTLVWIGGCSMGVFERKWVLALGVLILIIGFNGISGWMGSRGEKLLADAVPVMTEGEVPAVTSPSAADIEAPMVTVHVCGAVMKPGVFTLPEGSRVTNALEQAGGFSPKADTVSINLAEVMVDGQQIMIYEQSEDPAPGRTSGISKTQPANAAEQGLPVNINRGSMEALMLLDGIGEKTAQKIIDYRKSQGGFKSIEELKNVPGIGDKKYEQIKNDVRL